MTDVIIIGAGCAGLTAAIYAQRAGLSTILLEENFYGGQIAISNEIENYPAIPSITGPELAQQIYAQAESLGAQIRFETVTQAELSANPKVVTTHTERYEAKAVIIANGVKRRKLGCPGEEAFTGRGVSYCATCDGMLYRGKPVVVVGRSKDAPREAAYLKELGCQVVYVAAQRPEQLDPAIPFVQANRLEVEGEQTVTGLRADGSLLPCSGIFILREAVAPTDLLPGLETENGAIRVDRRMATSIPGVFAAGDCTGEPLQVSKAVGEGLTAALSAAEYLDQLPKKDTAK